MALVQHQSASLPMPHHHTKICRVCGDTALCFNFNGLCCEACKVFFRRAIRNNMKYRCKKSMNCVVNKATRKMCKRCRIEKCFRIGMKKEYVLSLCASKSPHYSSSSESESTTTGSFAPMMKLPKQVKSSTELLPYEVKRITELASAMSHFPDESSAVVATNPQVDFAYLANLNLHYVRSTIRYCKQLDAFQHFPPGDQLSLLKTFYPDMAPIYMAFLYDHVTNGMHICTDDSGDKSIFFRLVAPITFHNRHTVDQLRNFVAPMNAALGNDPTIRNLLIAQLLFKPHDSHGKYSELINYNHSTYGHLLRKYLAHRFKSQAERKYNSIMAVMSKLEPTSDAFRQLYHSEIDLQVLNPLLAELFNLKVYC